jgi:hypothetical protein
MKISFAPSVPTLAVKSNDNTHCANPRNSPITSVQPTNTWVILAEQLQALLDLGNSHVAGTGQEEWNHACDLCCYFYWTFPFKSTGG